MATEKQIEANRRNAQKSTGPATEVGKTKAKFNALKHGMTAVFHVLLLPVREASNAFRRRTASSPNVCRRTTPRFWVRQ